MHPGLVVKLRPSGPWRIGPDSGMRNRGDVIYHSDSLYSAVTSAMARLGSLEEWLDATSRPREPAAAPAVCFSSCFPFMDDIRYVVPPRTVWPPAFQAISARVRWKSARFVPLEVVQAILAGRKLDENRWTIDGPSECLTPAGSPGPFRTAVRWSAAVDRLTGATERHSTACLEFRPGCGLWTVASFAGEAARDRWRERVTAAFRLLADTGFGGERSRGWGRSEPPEFVEGTLPEMILPAIRETASQATEPASETEPQTPVEEPPAEPPIEEPPREQPPVEEPPAEPEGGSREEVEPAPTPPIEEPPQDGPPLEELAAEPAEAEASVQAQPEVAPLLAEPAEATEVALEPESPGPVGSTDEGVCPSLPSEDPQACGAGASACQPDPAAPDSAPAPVPVAVPEQPSPLAAPTPDTEALPEPESPGPVGLTDESVYPTLPPEDAEACGAAASASQPAIPQPPTPAAPDAAPVQAAVPEQPAPATTPAPGFEDARPHWLLSLFAPAPADAMDWKRGNYTVLSRGGRVESPAGSGELKKQVHMVAEGSVLLAAAAPRGSAADVAPDGFAHPVYRAGFAVSVPLPKVS
jgi:CRISPR type III-A-associated RAMP protein Csm4